MNTSSSKFKRSQTSLASTQQNFHSNSNNNNANEQFQSKLVDMNMDISKLNRKINQYNTNYDSIAALLQEEAKLRQNIERKTFFMHESLTEQIQKLKASFTELSNTLTSHVESIKDEILTDVRNNNSKFLSSFESNIKRFNEYEKHLSTNDTTKNALVHELENKLQIFEEVAANQYTVIKSELSSSNDKISSVQNQLLTTTTALSSEISKLKEEIVSLRASIESLRSEKTALKDSVSHITHALDAVHAQHEKTAQEISLITTEVDSKLKHYENVNKMLNDTFNALKSEITFQIEDNNLHCNSNLKTFQEKITGDIKQFKLDSDKFRINIITENQKFIDYIQQQSKTQNDNVKQLFDYTNGDVDLLKQKCDALENVIKNIRNEMLSTINNVEGFLTQRYDTIFKTLNSERTAL